MHKVLGTMGQCLIKTGGTPKHAAHHGIRGKPDADRTPNMAGRTSAAGTLIPSKVQVDLREFPLVAEAPVHSALVHAGDALFLPSFWTHHIHHLPRSGHGRNVRTHP